MSRDKGMDAHRGVSVHLNDQGNLGREASETIGQVALIDTGYPITLNEYRQAFSRTAWPFCVFLRMEAHTRREVVERNDTTPTRVDQQWLTTEQVAKLLQVSRRFVQHLIQQGELPSCSLGAHGKIHRVAPDDLHTYMAARRTPTQAAAL